MRVSNLENVGGKTEKTVVKVFGERKSAGQELNGPLLCHFGSRFDRFGSRTGTKPYLSIAGRSSTGGHVNIQAIVRADTLALRSGPARAVVAFLLNIMGLGPSPTAGRLALKAVGPMNG